MHPLATMTKEEAHGIEGLLFDLDDTLLTRGTLTRAAYDALWDLHDAGKRLVVVTGRPTRWGAMLATQWPIDAATTENGAIAIIREDKRVLVVDTCSVAERTRRRAALMALADDVRKRAPDVTLADDASLRVSDITWDIGEHVTIARDRIAFVESIILEHGARRSCSSVHLHATFDGDDKATGTVRLLGERFGVDVGAARTRWAFAGDSGNDRACFAAFATTFGVANVRASLGALSVPPRYVAPSAMGDGFAEIARALLK